MLTFEEALYAATAKGLAHNHGRGGEWLLCGTKEQILTWVLSLVSVDPIPMILHCPACGLQHIDMPDPQGEVSVQPDGHESRWDNPPHKSHLCAGCGWQWRPADVNTTGVAAIITRHTDDTPKYTNLHDDLELIHSLARMGCVQLANRVSEVREILVRIRELSERSKTVQP